MKELKYFTATEAAEMLGVMPRTVWQYIKEGKITARKIGRSWKITPESLKEFIEGKQAEPTLPIKEIREIREVQADKNEIRFNLEDGIITIYYADLNGLEQGRAQAKTWLK
jgi:excisionase family DNA binding protein